MAEKEGKAKEPRQEKQEERRRMSEAEHREWVRRGLEEEKREKKKAFGFQKKFQKRFDLRQRAMFGGKFTHGTMGKPTHGPRGNQG